MELEAALGMLESLVKLRKLLEEHAREMQRLKIENDWLKKVLEIGLAKLWCASRWEKLRLEKRCGGT